MLQALVLTSRGAKNREPFDDAPDRQVASRPEEGKPGRWIVHRMAQGLTATSPASPNPPRITPLKCLATRARYPSARGCETLDVVFNVGCNDWLGMERLRQIENDAVAV